MVTKATSPSSVLFIASFIVFVSAKPHNFQFFDQKQAFFAENELDDYHIVYPSLVSERGQFLSHAVHDDHVRRLRRSLAEFNQSISSSDEEQPLFYRLKLNSSSEEIHLKLQSSKNIVAPGFVIERASGMIQPYTSSCLYQGHVTGQHKSMVAISNCVGLQGMILTSDGQDFLIEPIIGHEPTDAEANPHLLYKASHLRKARSLDTNDKNLACGTTHKKRRKRTKRKAGRSPELERILRRAARRSRRSISKERYVETLVVVDRTMLEFYRGQDLEQYVLTVMNMVAALYHDASVGAAINIVVVRLFLLDNDRDDLTISHDAESTLSSFCSWSNKLNPPSEYHPQHHDIAILLTRRDICLGMDKPCGTLGLAQVSGMCSKDRSCNVNEDTGLSVAYTVAHELGHNFGMEHDGLGNKCKYAINDDRFIMSPTQSLTNHPYMWSSCSREYIRKFLFKGFGWCLDDEPSNHKYEYKTVLPGVIYDLDQQCKMRHGPQSGVCHVQWIQDGDPCSRLWCRFEYQSTTTCVMRNKPAADGTFCKHNHWCYRGRCIRKQELPEAVDGRWGPWSKWSTCSRSCGGGVRSKERHCDNPRPKNGGKYCLGVYKKYQICNKQECKSKTGYRDQQCEFYALHVFPTYIDARSRVESVYFPDRPCELHCRNRGSFHSIKILDEVMDGTPCREGHNDVCISGKCEPVGCDWVLHSKAKEDKCGVCHGDGSSCQTIKSQFNETDLSQGEYVQTAVIPAGARYIRVEEVRSAENYLALKSSSGFYYLNGHWSIQDTGKYDAAGTKVFYARRNQKDQLRAIGPTNEDLYVQLFVQGPNPGVNIEFTIPKDNKTNIKTSYSWRYTGWSRCSVKCGKGMRILKPECIETHLMSPVDDRYCDEEKKPVKLEKSCNMKKCPPEWLTGSWQKCSKSCGKGVSRRSVICVRRTKKDEQLALRMDQCDKTKKPVEERPCYKGKCKARWIKGAWGKCSTGCGMGVQRRTVLCSSQNINMCRQLPKPAEMKLCNGTHCPHWITGPWGNCNTNCGTGIRVRTVACYDSLSQRHISSNRCRGEVRPIDKEACFTRSCINWTTSPWSPCSRSCGNGTQTRSVTCLIRNRCRLNEKPESQKSCSKKECATWRTGRWGECSKSCVQWRTVVCRAIGTSASASSCSYRTRPPVTRNCRGGRCGPAAYNYRKPRSQVCNGDRLSKQFCNVVKIANFCSVTRYYSHCCATCSSASR